MSAALLEKLRTQQGLTQDEALSLARPEHAADLLKLAEEGDPACAGDALLLLAHLEDERLIPLALQALEKDPDHVDAARALLWVGPTGRIALRDLGRTNKLGITTMLDGLNLPSMRPALLEHLVWLVRQTDLPRKWGQLAAAMLVSHGWASAAALLAGRSQALRLPPGAVDSWALAGYPRTSQVHPCDPPLESFLPRPLAEIIPRCQELARQEKARRLAVQAEAREYLASLPVPIQVCGPGRNEPCSCGSGKKYKKCCLESDQLRSRRHPWQAVQIRCEGFRLPPPCLEDADEVLALWTSGQRPRVMPESPTLRWAIALISPPHTAFEIALELVEAAVPSSELDYPGILTMAILYAEECPGLAATLAIPAVATRGELHHVLALTELLVRACPGSVSELVESLVQAKTDAQRLLLVAFAASDAYQQPWREPLEAYLRQLEGAADVLELVARLPGRSASAPTATRSLPAVPRPQDPDLHLAEARFYDVLQRHLTLLTPVYFTHELTADSADPMARESELRQRLADQQEQELHRVHGTLCEAQLRVLESQPEVLFFMLSEAELLWLLPVASSPELLAAAATAAGQLAGEAECGVPRALARQGRLVIAQPDHSQAASAAEMARVALEERLLARGLPPLEMGLFPVNVKLEDSSLPTDLLAHLLAQARAGRDPVPLPSGSAPKAPEVSPPEPETPNPGREALRKVLRRLHRMHKIGEAHTSIDLVWRGVEGHLRGEVKEYVQGMLRQGLLRDKPTLAGQHVSLEPRHLPAIERFIEAGGGLGGVI